ncbi:MAG: hypothetical protein ACYTF6_03725 [Planctomycetota bacterium]|jgi:hypothetical protein
MEKPVQAEPLADRPGGGASRAAAYFALAMTAGAAATVHWSLEPVVFDSELSWVQIAQGASYAAALVVAILTARRLRRRRRGEWAVVTLVAFLMFSLLLRETEPESQLFGLPHMFSFNYFFKPEMTVRVKLAVGIPAILMIVVAAWWTVAHRVVIKEHLPSVVRRRWLAILVAGGCLLAVSQFVDRAASWQRHFGLELPGLYEREKRRLRNVEEIVELVGAMLVMFSIVELRIGLLRGPRGGSESSGPQG